MPESAATADTDRTALTTQAQAATGAAARLAALRVPLPKPAQVIEPELQGLTPSERIFKMHTGNGASSLKISKDGDEFFAFYDTRYAGKWHSHFMSTDDYVRAAEAFNMRLDELRQRRGLPPLKEKKSASAVYKRLLEVEADLKTRLAKQDFRRRSAFSKPASGECVLCGRCRAAC